MDLQRLAKVKDLDIEIKLLREEMEGARQRAMIHSAGANDTKTDKGQRDHLQDAVTSAVVLEKLITERVKELERERCAIMEFISTIQDSHIRTIAILRYIDGKTWEETAQYIGGGNSASGVRKALKRYCKRSM